MIVIYRPIGLGASMASAGDTGYELLSATNPDTCEESVTDPLFVTRRNDGEAGASGLSSPAAPQDDAVAPW